MTTAVQRRRGTNTEHASFTGLEGEISVNTTNESVHVHDGSTAGGFELMRADGSNSSVSLGDITGVTAGTGLSGGGTSGTVTLNIDGTVATLTGTQTLTNKTLTSPILNTPDINAGSIDGTAIGASSASTGAFTTLTATGLTVDTDTLYVDSTNNRVGIGTTSPSTPLDIKLNTNSTADIFKFQRNDGAVAGVLNYSGTDGAISLGTTTSHDFTFDTAGSERMRIDSSGQVKIHTPITNDFFGLSLQYNNTDTADFKVNQATGQIKIGGVATNYYPTFWSSGSERMRIDSSGNVGIGRIPRVALDVDGEVAIAYNSTYGLRFYNQPQNNWSSIGNTETSSSANLVFKDGSGEAFRLDGSGNLLVGKTAVNFTTVGAELRSNGQINSGSTADFLNMFSTSASAYRFYVTNAGTIKATNTTISAISDQRFKENIRDLDDGLSKVMELRPRKFDWKEGKGADIKDDRGFIAQEFEQVFPDLVGEWKDEAPEGEEPYKAVSQDLIPTLVKAIQEQQTLIESLTARIAALEE